MRFIGPGIVTFTLFAATAPAAADIQFRFYEGAPTDSFVMYNDGSCGLGPMTVTWDLSQSAAGLYFDTTGTGAGVQVYQPFALVAGRDFVKSITPVRDGSKTVTITINDLAPRETIVFTIDVDDSLQQSPNGQIMIAGSEISGARVSLSSQFGYQGETVFGHDAVARLPYQACQS